MNKPVMGRKVALEVGHGYRTKLINGVEKTYYDPGALGAGGEPSEHELGIYRAAIIKRMLIEQGIYAEILDEAVPNGQVWKRAAEFDCFLSLHLNSFPEKPGQSEVQGTETLVHPTAGLESRSFAAAIQKELVSRLGFHDRGVKEQKLAILGGIPKEIPACLSEAFFIDAVHDQSPWVLAEWSAFAIAQGISSYLGSLKK